MLAHSIDDSARTEDVVVVENVTFESFLLSDNTFKGLKENGFKKPSPIQLKAIPVGRCGFDLIVKSKSGTGKTLVFSIIALECLSFKQKKIQALILSPTREIAVQSQDVIKRIGCFYKDLKVESFIGGLSLAEDKETCKACHIAVGTPGRIKQLITEKCLNTDSVRLFVLDEVDKLMEQSFRNDLNEIYNSLPVKKQMITTSATYPHQLDEFLSKYMLTPTHITAELDSPLLLGLKQFVVITKPAPTAVQLMKLKNEELVNIITNISFTQCLIFSNYQTRAESLSNFLNQKGWHSTFISAAQNQIQRLEAINKLKDLKCRILISTDLTARGIDAANVDLIVNYDIPIDAMTYLHRMGRAGRYGSTGVCINIASEGSDLSHLQEILGFIGGTALSIAKLPKFNGTILGLLKLKVPVDEYIYGLINDENKDKSVSKVFEMMKKENKDDKNIEILNILNESKSEVEKIKQQISEMDASEILTSLLDQKFDMEQTSDKNSRTLQVFEVNAVLKTLTDNSPKSSISEEQKPAKIQISDAEIQEKNRKTLLTKNKALLNVSKILSGSNIDEDKTSIEEHLKLIKFQEKNLITELSKKDANELVNILSQTKEEIIQTPNVSTSKTSGSKSNSEDDSKKFCKEVIQTPFASTSKMSGSESSPENDFKKFETFEENEKETDVNQFDIQKLFQFGYKNIVKSENKNWRSILSEMMKTPFKISDNEEEQEEDDDDDHMEGETSDSENISDQEIIESKQKKLKQEDVGVEVEEKSTKKNEGKTEEEDINNSTDKSLQKVRLGNKKRRKNKKMAKTTEGNGDGRETNIMKWVPVESGEKECDTIKPNCLLEPSTNDEGTEEYNHYFQECSNNLWQNGLSFDSVEAFDEWFYYEWEAQLYSIRNYVQQNVYVNEMAKYQNFKKDCKNS